MRRLFIPILLFAFISCNDDDPKKYTSIVGPWIVRTPDDATRVSFRIDKDPDNAYDVFDTVVNHNGSDYDSKPIDAAVDVVSETGISSITFATGDANIPFFNIELSEITVNASFTEIQIAHATFQIDGVAREFTMLTATRN